MTMTAAMFEQLLFSLLSHTSDVLALSSTPRLSPSFSISFFPSLARSDGRSISLTLARASSLLPYHLRRRLIPRFTCFTFKYLGLLVSLHVAYDAGEYCNVSLSLHAYPFPNGNSVGLSMPKIQCFHARKLIGFSTL